MNIDYSKYKSHVFSSGSTLVQFGHVFHCPTILKLTDFGAIFPKIRTMKSEGVLVTIVLVICYIFGTHAETTVSIARNNNNRDLLPRLGSGFKKYPLQPLQLPDGAATTSMESGQVLTRRRKRGTSSSKERNRDGRAGNNYHVLFEHYSAKGQPYGMNLENFVESGGCNILPPTWQKRVSGARVCAGCIRLYSTRDCDGKRSSDLASWNGCGSTPLRRK